MTCVTTTDYNLGTNWGFYNGCASIKLYGCNARSQTEATTATRNILFAYIDPVTDSRFVAAAFGSGNRLISFFGGIFRLSAYNTRPSGAYATLSLRSGRAVSLLTGSSSY
jgi:hypothetical protein